MLVERFLSRLLPESLKYKTIKPPIGPTEEEKRNQKGMTSAMYERVKLEEWMREVEAQTSGVKPVEPDREKMIEEAISEGKRRAWFDANNPRSRK